MKRTALYRVTFLCIALQTVEAVGLPRIGGIPGHVFNLAASAPWCFHGIFTGVLEICGLEMSPVGKFMPVVVRLAKMRGTSRPAHFAEPCPSFCNENSVRNSCPQGCACRVLNELKPPLYMCFQEGKTQPMGFSEV
ncbi:uncharacterized protein LOC119173336 isoform X2 [Rhipicephalus microplus]|uniref:uncharacterized protein LOC119173336 isoform X2 n=1 Tax=Rhipicephalus microplus TaxID=6941 RepID=UPI003F6A60F7